MFDSIRSCGGAPAGGRGGGERGGQSQPAEDDPPEIVWEGAEKFFAEAPFQGVFAAEEVAKSFARVGKREGGVTRTTSGSSERGSAGGLSPGVAAASKGPSSPGPPEDGPVGGEAQDVGWEAPVGLEGGPAGLG